METRPKIRPEPSPLDIIIEIAGWLALSVLWIIILYNYRKLPGAIPVHYNAAGQVDHYGAKATIFLLPALGTVLFIGMTILNRFPRIFNYPVRITEENAFRQYTMVTRMVRYLKLSIILIFTITTWNTLSIAFGRQNRLGILLLPLILFMIFVPLGYYIYKSFKSK